MGSPKNDDLQSEGRERNAAQPLDAHKNTGGAERYPPTRKDDSIEVGTEKRGFASNPQPRQGAGDGGPAASTNEGRLGPGADPAEGKR
jgi:hypothetical protein